MKTFAGEGVGFCLTDLYIKGGINAKMPFLATEITKI